MSTARVRLNIFWIAAALAGAAGAVAVARFAWVNGEGGLLPLGLLVIAFVCTLLAATPSFSAACPSCGATSLRPVLGRSIMLCSGCHEHALQDGSAFRPVPPDYVHSRSVFSAALPVDTKWDGCVACCRPATRTLTSRVVDRRATGEPISRAGLTLLETVGIPFTQTDGERAWKLRLPFCNAHHQGAIVDTEGGEVIIRFRSYAAYKAFLAANGLDPLAPTE